jgi:hypothetical protein
VFAVRETASEEEAAAEAAAAKITNSLCPTVQQSGNASPDIELLQNGRRMASIYKVSSSRIQSLLRRRHQTMVVSSWHKTV